MSFESLLGPAWWIVLTVIVTTIVNVLYLLARWLHEESQLHELRVEAHTIRRALKEELAWRRIYEIQRRSTYTPFEYGSTSASSSEEIIEAEPVQKAA